MGNTKATKWTDQVIHDSISEVQKWLDIDRMPSRSECISYYQNEALVNAISRRSGGWKQVASDLGISMKESETRFGKDMEDYAESILISNGFSVTRMSQNFAYDILVNECVKVDVKASRQYFGKNGAFYSFNLEKPYMTCDIYMLFCMNNQKEVEHIIVLPSVLVYKNSQISIGTINSKYYEFEDRFEYISEYVNYYRAIRDRANLKAVV